MSIQKQGTFQKYVKEHRSCLVGCFALVSVKGGLYV